MKHLPIYFSDTPEEGVTEETPAEETDKPSKAAKRKRPAEKRATKKKKSEQVSQYYPLSDVLDKQHSLLFLLWIIFFDKKISGTKSHDCYRYSVTACLM